MLPVELRPLDDNGSPLLGQEGRLWLVGHRRVVAEPSRAPLETHHPCRGLRPRLSPPRPRRG
jgi:hypothetical protein